LFESSDSNAGLSAFIGIVSIPQRAGTLAAIRGVGGRNEKKFDFNSYISLFS